MFVGANVVWSNEEKYGGGCEPGGPAIPDGAFLAHDLVTGVDSPVDLGFYSALMGVPSPQYITTTWVLDTKF